MAQHSSTGACIEMWERVGWECSLQETGKRGRAPLFKLLQGAACIAHPFGKMSTKDTDHHQPEG